MIFVVFTVLLLYAKGQFLVKFSNCLILFSLGLQIPHCQDDEGNNVDLFELTCTPHSESSTHQMSITIKESCRKSNFLGIDFAHSFIWGDQVRIFICQGDLFCIRWALVTNFRPYERWTTQQSIRQLEYDLIITMFNVMTSCLVLELTVKARAWTGFLKLRFKFWESQSV